MYRCAKVVYVLAILVLLTSLPVLGAEKPIVVTTTSVLASIVRDLAGDRVVVEVVASPSVCPAHYDVKPSDIDKFRHASLILYHGFEPWVRELAEASGTKAPLVKVPGPWNTPESLKKLYMRVAEALEKYLGLNVSERLRRCLASIDATARWLKSFAESHGFVGVPVVVMKWQEPFVSYLGFKVVAVFKPPEMVSPKELEEVIANATRARAVLVIDNLQSGTDLGEKIAEEVGAVEVALTNFPGTAPGVSNVTEMMKFNAKLLAKALRAAKWRIELRNASTSIDKLEKEVSELQRDLGIARSEARNWMLAFTVSMSINAVLITIVILLYRKLKRV